MCAKYNMQRLRHEPRRTTGRKNDRLRKEQGRLSDKRSFFRSLGPIIGRRECRVVRSGVYELVRNWWQGKVSLTMRSGAGRYVARSVRRRVSHVLMRRPTHHHIVAAARYCWTNVEHEPK